jgi:hypothetical protein
VSNKIVRTRAVTIVLLALFSGIGHFRWLSAPLADGWTMVQWRLVALAAAVAIGGMAAFRIRSAALVTASVAMGLVAGGTTAQLAGDNPYLIAAARTYLSTLWVDAVSQSAAAGLAARFALRKLNRRWSREAAQIARPQGLRHDELVRNDGIRQDPTQS